VVDEGGSMIRMTLGIVVLVAVLLLSACQGNAQKSSQIIQQPPKSRQQLSKDELIAEEWAVYSVFLEREGQVIVNETISDFSHYHVLV
jgi:hypothetical protein